MKTVLALIVVAFAAASASAQPYMTPIAPLCDAVPACRSCYDDAKDAWLAAVKTCATSPAPVVQCRQDATDAFNDAVQDCYDDLLQATITICPIDIAFPEVWQDPELYEDLNACLWNAWVDYVNDLAEWLLNQNTLTCQQVQDEAADRTDDYYDEIAFCYALYDDFTAPDSVYQQIDQTNRWLSGDMSADTNRDGQLTVLDLDGLS